jgi:hypothetical protein
MPGQPDPTASLAAYPNLRLAARILGVSASTLSRRSDLSGERRGDRDVALAPAEILRLAAIYRKRSLNDVAHDLLEESGEPGSEERRRIEEQIEEYFEANTIAGDRAELLRLARRLLPPKLADEVKASLARAPDQLPDVIEGYVPSPAS